MVDLARFHGLDSPIPLDTSSGQAGYLLIRDDEVPIRLSASAYHLLQAVRSGVDFATLAEALSRKQGREVSADELNTAYARILTQLAAAGSGRRRHPPGFWMRWPILSQAWVERLVARFTWLFTRAAAVPLLLIAGTASILALRHGLVPELEGAIFWPGYLLFTVSLVAHELGHAAACARYGARPREIGFTVYLIYPAFYSNVTAAWQLRRGERVVVDLGGIYFQLLAGGVFAAAFLATDVLAFLTALQMIAVSCLFALNPVFRLDGYWVLTDALGVTHLARQPARLVRHLWARLRRQPVPPLPWPRWVTAVLLVYTPLTIAIWSFFVVQLAPEVGSRLLALPGLGQAALSDVAALRWPAAELLQDAAATLWVLVIAAVLTWQLLVRLMAFLAARRPAFRGVATPAGDRVPAP